jgi:putative SOS response-associated peptidase YedK
MPVILTDENEVDVWLHAPTPVATELQRPLTEDRLETVAKGERLDQM